MKQFQVSHGGPGLVAWRSRARRPSSAGPLGPPKVGLARVLVVGLLTVGVAFPLAGPAPAADELPPPDGATETPAVDQPTGEPGTAPPSDGGAVAAPDGLVHLSVLPGGSEVRYRLKLRVIGQPPSEGVCSTRSVSGEIALAPDGSVGGASKLTVDQRTLRCTPPLRDSMAQSLLETQLYPLAEFVVRQTPGLSVPLPSGDLGFQMVGDQAVHGVTRPVSYATASNFGDQQANGLATTLLKMTDFNMKPPRIGPLISVEDDLTVEFAFGLGISRPTASAAPPAP